MRTLLVLIAALLCAGCTRHEPVSLHGAGSMRVEVEVYKGPLSVSPGAQVGQMVAVMADLVRATVDWRESIKVQFGNVEDAQCRFVELGKTPTVRHFDPRDCAMLKSAFDSSGDVIGAACYIFNTPTLSRTVGPAVYLPLETCTKFEQDWKHLGTYHRVLDEALAACQPGKDGTPDLLRCQGGTIVLAVENLASMMRTAAFREANSHVAYVPQDQRVRMALTRFGYIASEYGNQIQGRIGVLEKQIGQGIEARDLPVGDYLRSARPTDFVQLFHWLKAGDPDGKVMRVEDRVRMAERLTSDFYWEKVNEVYASGQGDVSMAFIKDDLGNWNLKSFSNDPRALLASYRKVTDAALKATAKLAANAATGGGAEGVAQAGRMAALANQLATGQVPGGNATVAGLDVGGLHDRAVARIAAIRERFATRGRGLDTEIAAQTEAIEGATKDAAEKTQARIARQVAVDASDTAETRNALNEATAAVTEAEAKVAMGQDTLDRLQRRKAELPSEAIEALRAALGDHLAVIAAMQDGIAASSTPSSPPTRP
ncbi:hypothetical protein [Sphingomonas sp. SAFR-052]|uniref:hypothetical protein n=1 Tax=Sphingomonas sp. SAFR-052 TaxID=3436867 RepID=UPI003F7D3232